MSATCPMYTVDCEVWTVELLDPRTGLWSFLATIHARTLVAAKRQAIRQFGRRGRIRVCGESLPF